MTVIFEPLLPNFGFDDTVSPEWLMVPVRDEKPIWVVNGGGLSVSSTSPAIATASFDKPTANSRPNYQVLRVKGKMTGRAFIELKKENKVVKRLEVSVKPEVIIKLSFHFVSDSAIPKNHSTNRKPGDLKDMIFWLNQFYTPQTNIKFELRNFFNLKLQGNLGDAVNYNFDYQSGQFMKGHEFDLVTSKRDRSAHINIFFVWKNEFLSKNAQGKIEKSGALGYSAGGRDTLIEDWDGILDRDGDNIPDNTPVWENARMLAHEIGHILGIADITKTKKVKMPHGNQVELVYVNDNYIMGSGPFIPKFHANIMSAIAKQIAGIK